MCSITPASKSALPALVRVGRSVPPPHSSLGVLDFSQIKKQIKLRRHPFGMAKNYGSKAKGACNQGKEAFRAKSMQSGQLRPSVTTGEARQTHAYVSQGTGKKKKPRNRLFSTFYVKHSKDLCQRCVTRANKNFIP